MKSQFSEFYRPSEDEFAELWKKAIFVVDANFLLALYRYSDNTSKKLLELLKTIAQEDQLWIPHQVALEYHTNRLRVIDAQAHQYRNTLTEIDKIKSRFQSKTHPFLGKKRFKELEAVLDKIQKEDS